MIEISQIKIPLNPSALPDADTKDALFRKKAARKLRLPEEALTGVACLKHAIDARKKPQLFDVYTVGVTLADDTMEQEVVRRARSSDVRISARKTFSLPGKITPPDGDPPVIVTGTGPAGLFCAYVLALSGVRVLVLERGRSVAERTKDVQRLFTEGVLDPTSNVQFGEGGAGTFSDGKLYTSARDKTGMMRYVLETFVRHGAAREILYESDPHIGTDVLADVICSMRKTIEANGGEVLFATRLEELMIEADPRGMRVKGVRTGRGTFLADRVVLATGHSARDTYRMLADLKVCMEPKPFAYGLRIAHPQKVIDRAMYGLAERGALPAAHYKLTARAASGRSVYTFCMCPGGHIINASSEEGGVCVNGMSLSGRDGAFANSAVIAAVAVSDYYNGDVLDGMYLQRTLEERACLAGNGAVPVSTLEAFLSGTREVTGEIIHRQEVLGRCVRADLREIFPAQMSADIADGITRFGQMLQGFDAPDALLAGVESRTSAPVRIVRGEDLESVNCAGLYPAGEGAGYAGGIMSAAVDGIRCALRILEISGRKSCG